MNFNLIVLGGRLTRDPQTRTTTSGTVVCEFGIAVNEKRKESEKAHFFDCTAFGKTAELIGEHMAKGREILIHGRLDHQTWEDKQGGKRSKHVVIVEQFQFVGPREQGGDGDGPQRDVTNPRPAVGNWQGAKLPAKAKVPAPQPFGDEEQFRDAEIPFESAPAR